MVMANVVVGVAGIVMLSCGVAAADGEPARGFTVEVDLGIGWLHESADGYRTTRPVSLTPPNLSIGAFVTDRIAIVARLAGTLGKDGDVGVRYLQELVGPEVQYWFTPELWAAAGLGLGTYGDVDDTSFENGIAVDLRAGYTFLARGHHSMNVSVESVVGRYHELDDLTPNGYTATATSFAFQLGYQFF